MRTIKKPYHLILISILIIVAFRLFSAADTIDIHFLDTYFVLQNDYFYGLMASILLLFWLLYVLVNKLLFSQWLTWLHIVLTVLSILWLTYSTYQMNADTSGYADYRLWTAYTNSNNGLAILLILFSLGQLLLISNVIAGVVRLISRRRHTRVPPNDR